jgi:hypothetical protein
MPMDMAPALKSDVEHEHPVIAWIGIVAVLAAIVLILWARFEIHGTHDLRTTLASDAPKPAAAGRRPSPGADRPAREAEVDEAVAAGRWAAGFSP